MVCKKITLIFFTNGCSLYVYTYWSLFRKFLHFEQFCSTRLYFVYMLHLLFVIYSNNKWPTLPLIWGVFLWAQDSIRIYKKNVLWYAMQMSIKNQFMFYFFVYFVLFSLHLIVIFAEIMLSSWNILGFDEGTSMWERERERRFIPVSFSWQE